jgi:hypothetical protein
MTLEQDYALWRAYCELKVKKLEKSLERPSGSHDSYVFALFRRHTRLFLEWLIGNLEQPADLPGLTTEERNQHRSTSARQTLEALDDLAQYMRFYESAQFQDVPFPLIDHVQSIFSQLESHDEILLRPQNDQQFETRGEFHDVKGRLSSLFALIGDPTPIRDKLIEEIDALPNIFVISYPKYFGDTFLFYPLFGHELAHVVYRMRELESRITQTRTRELIAANSATARLQRRLAKNWARELFCDLVGFHLYGEPYIYALWMFLYKYRETLKAETVATYLLMQVPPAMGALEKVTNDVFKYTDDGRAPDRETVTSRVKALLTDVAAAKELPEKQRVQFEHYPSPGRRIRELVTRCEAMPDISSSKVFSQWRVAFLERYGRYEETFQEQAFANALDVARRISGELFETVAATLPASPSATAHIADTDQLTQLLERWIPPCETIANEVTEPASWSAILLAAWVRFVELASSNQGDARGADWPLEWLDFVYQAFDMNSLYSTFRAVKASVAQRPD